MNAGRGVGSAREGLLMFCTTWRSWEEFGGRMGLAGTGTWVLPGPGRRRGRELPARRRKQSPAAALRRGLRFKLEGWERVGAGSPTVVPSQTEADGQANCACFPPERSSCLPLALLVAEWSLLASLLREGLGLARWHPGPGRGCFSCGAEGRGLRSHHPFARSAYDLKKKILLS